MSDKTKNILIRDDDIGYFTDLKVFQAVHRILLERQIPFNVAVVPNSRADIMAPAGGYEGFISHRHCGKPGYFPVSENRTLTSFIKSHPFIAVAQHGFSHHKTVMGLPEYAGEKSDELEENLEKGNKLLEEIFGSRPAFFIPPYDTVSKSVLQMLRGRFKGICLSRISRRLLPLSLWWRHWNMKRKRLYLFKWNGFQILQHPGLDFSFLEPSDRHWNQYGFLSLARDVLVLPIHSWRFFRKGKPDKALLDRWHGLLGSIVSRPDVKFVRFSDLPNIG
jgi:peptidoglycan/xylan/chitin deacetylase (PgdA/CDA1 family)